MTRDDRCSYRLEAARAKEHAAPVRRHHRQRTCGGAGDTVLEMGVGCLDAESVPDALAGYWTRVLARVKERSEAVRAKETPEE